MNDSNPKLMDKPIKKGGVFLMEVLIHHKIFRIKVNKA